MSEAGWYRTTKAYLAKYWYNTSFYTLNIYTLLSIVNKIQMSVVLIINRFL